MNDKHILRINTMKILTKDNFIILMLLFAAPFIGLLISITSVFVICLSPILIGIFIYHNKKKEYKNEKNQS